ncbi:MAG TPA: Rieske 2Fe-2S domain-containing protein [Actinomycetes bacterium]|nr:Rieske 2Fe-2S domain-containing protein [Actinomycetes bacterium]
MTRPRLGRPRPSAEVPTDCWYALTASAGIGRELTAWRAGDRPLVLFRGTGGEVVALEDRCAHRPYPLSAGRLDGDLVRCGLCGFAYDARGRCVSVPTQTRVPYGASVPVYPVREENGLVWVWLGEPGRAPLHRLPDLDWLDDDAWGSVGGEQDVAAGFLLLHESFADVTQIPVLAPDVSPAVLLAQPPPLDVVVSETTVSLSRTFPAGPLPGWQARALGRRADEELVHRQEGHFLSPAVWVDHWDVLPEDGAPPARMRFTQLVLPVDRGTSRLMWRVSRDFAVDDAATTDHLERMFTSYYLRVSSAMETMQRVIDRDGPGAGVNVQADVAALKVRQIVTSLLAEEGAATRR